MSYSYIVGSKVPSPVPMPCAKQGRAVRLCWGAREGGRDKTWWQVRSAAVTTPAACVSITYSFLWLLPPLRWRLEEAKGDWGARSPQDRHAALIVSLLLFWMAPYKLQMSSWDIGNRWPSPWWSPFQAILSIVTAFIWSCHTSQPRYLYHSLDLKRTVAWP